MGFNIGSIAKDLGINLPKIDLGNIGKTVLEEGKKLLGEVVKDSFTLSSKPGETFADDMNLNVLGESVRLPNPIGRLANKLLGSVDSKLGQFGVNIDFKTALSKLFHLPTEAGSVTVPPLKSRIASGAFAAPGAQATGGGMVAQSFARTEAPGSAATGGASEANTPVTQVGGSAVDGVFSSLGNAESGLLGTLNEAMTQTPDDKGMISIGGKKVNANAYLQNLQFRLSSLHEMMNTLSNILKDENQARMNTINNLRG
jgi:hypothetical protein